MSRVGEGRATFRDAAAETLVRRRRRGDAKRRKVRQVGRPRPRHRPRRRGHRRRARPRGLVFGLVTIIVSLLVAVLALAGYLVTWLAVLVAAGVSGTVAVFEVQRELRGGPAAYRGPVKISEPRRHTGRKRRSTGGVEGSGGPRATRRRTCSARCQTSTRPVSECDCSCGGSSHGRTTRERV